MTSPSPPRVLVTRAEGPDGPLSALLASGGFTPVVAPAVREVTLVAEEELDRRLGSLEGARWFVVTSPRAVRILSELGLFARPTPRALRIAAAGTATAAALESVGWPATVVPDEAGAAPLARALRAMDSKPAGTVLFPCSARARPELPRVLSEAGYTVAEIPVYDMESAPQDPARWRDIRAGGGLHAVTFTSPSCVEGLTRGLGDAGLDRILRELRDRPVAVQGPTTAAAARDAGWREPVEARPRTFAGLVDAVRVALGAGALASSSSAEVDS